MTPSETKNTASSIYLKLEKVYFLIAAVSIVLAVWQHWGMNRLVEIYPSQAQVSLGGDFLNDGISEGALNVSEDGAKLSCEVKPSWTFAHCTMNISIGDGENEGLDLRKFDSLNLWLEHYSSEQDTVIVYLKNREKSSKNLDPSTRNVNNKQNQQTILPVQGEEYYQLPLSSFTVPSWWILLHHATGIDAETKLNNVIELDIATGDNLNARSVSILLKRATLTGKWLEASVLYSGLAIIWILFITVHAGFRTYYLANQLQLKRNQNAALADLNNFLSIQKDEFEVLAKTDPLTGLSNRAGSRDFFEDMQSQENKIYSLIMFDIDNFKQINDVHGHQLGDDILIELSALVATLVRNTDHLARWGGEEFIVICPDTDIKEAFAIANLLREKIAAKTYSGELTVTCSFGLSSYDQRVKNSIQRMFEVADAALYKAKNGGRNRVEY
jgi:diguanylate cyclase (GGDEF)-like protein